MKKKLYITRSLKLISFGLAVVLSTFFLQSFLLKRIDNNTMRMEAFYLEEKNTVDAVLIGASDVYAGYAAPYAYEKYGYTSYPYATQASPSNIVLPQIKEVLKYQNPKMVIVEINAFLYKDNELPNEASARMFADNVPRDDIWRDYLKDAIPEDKQLEYYLPIIKYHSSWNEYPWKLKYLTAEIGLKKNGYSLFRGYKTVANEFHPDSKVYNDQLKDNDKTLPLAVNGERYLRQTLEYLKENNITNVMFMRFPHIVNDAAYSRFKRCNEAGKIIESYGYDFVNLERYGDAANIDVNKDYYNWDHLNVYGSEKVTDYIANMLQTKYGITKTELTEKQTAEWNDSVNYYHMIYNYCQEMIKRRLELGKTGNGGTTVSEDEKSISTIERYARNHPDAGKYDVILDDEKDS
ncbi:hypothetical protein [Ruminococcus sp.]|uniref:hypothetical protein n=1 Tax=Ruminococcus sp. TaxID=41978 RepID=UPI00386421C3